MLKTGNNLNLVKNVLVSSCGGSFDLLGLATRRDWVPWKGNEINLEWNEIYCILIPERLSEWTECHRSWCLTRLLRQMTNVIIIKLFCLCCGCCGCCGDVAISPDASRECVPWKRERKEIESIIARRLQETKQDYLGITFLWGAYASSSRKEWMNPSITKILTRIMDGVRTMIYSFIE